MVTPGGAGTSVASVSNGVTGSSGVDGVPAVTRIAVDPGSSKVPF